MTKIIRFSAVEILPALLSKKKTQTIRPAWLQGAYIKDYKEELKPTLPRFKKGEEVKLYWKQRSTYTHFCKFCGRGVKPFQICEKCQEGMLFNKILGLAEITEVFEVEMVLNACSTVQIPKCYWEVFITMQFTKPQTEEQTGRMLTA